MSKLNVGNDSSDNNNNNTSTQVTNTNTNQYLKVNYNNSIKDLLIPTKDTLDQLKEFGVVYSAKKLETGTNLNTDLSKTDPFNFDGSTETGTLGITGTLPIGHGGTGVTSRTEALTALQAGGNEADANVVAAGTYLLNTDTASNLPPEPGYYLLSVFRYDTSDLACGQIAIHLADGTLYSRDYVSGNWKRWVCCSSNKIDNIYIPDGADLNDYKHKGFYASALYGNSITNTPSDLVGGAFELVVTGISDNADAAYCSQWLKSHASNKIWIRTQSRYAEPWVWSDWEQVILSNTSILTPNGIELGQLLPSTAGHGGYIDFHFNGSTNDYTSRLIESESGVIKDMGNFATSGWIQSFGGIWVSGRGFFVNSDVYGTSLPAAGTAGRVFFKKA